MSDDNFSLPTITLDEFQQAPLTALENSSSVEVCDNNQTPLFYCLSK